ncbi:MAG: Mu transposase C-terminal domain-containing protein [Desulfarculales bacterium]|jgi:transposase InsO family protein/transposase|nr:Mu transposase C-terminal domain-containing protein [Desulfarculales bacterium]
MNIMGNISAQQIASVLGCTKRGITKRAKEEFWPISEQGPRNQWFFNEKSLPYDIQFALFKRREQEAIEAEAKRLSREKLKLAEALEEIKQQQTLKKGTHKLAGMPPDRQNSAQARANILRACRRWGRERGMSNREARDKFTDLYNNVETVSIYIDTDTQQIIPNISSITLYRWQNAAKKGGIAALARKQRAASCRLKKDKEIEKTIISMLIDYPHSSAKHIYTALTIRFGSDCGSKRSLQRFMKQWKQENQQLFEAITNPDLWRSKYKAAGGNASAQVVRLNQVWEIDSTKADIILADGKRHVVVGLIDVYSRRKKLHVSRSSSSSAEASLLRKALLEWGVPEVLVTDNGSDYISTHIKGALFSLGVEQQICDPFAPEQKPHIERAFNTFSHGLLELLPGFIGHNVAERKNIEARRSFAARLMDPHEKLEINLTPEEFQEFCDKWTDTIYGQEPHNGLGGKTPWEMAASWPIPINKIEDVAALNALLMPPIGARVISKKGIQLDGSHYISAGFAGYEGKQVLVRQDEAELGVIHIYDDNGAFVCEAVCPELLGISGQEIAIAWKKRQAELLAAQKQEMRQLTKRSNTKNIAQEILRDRAEAAGKLIRLPQPSQPYTSPGLIEAGKAARANLIPESTPLTSEQRTALQEDIRESSKVEVLEDPRQRYARWVNLDEKIKASYMGSQEEIKFHQLYPKCNEYSVQSMLAEDFGIWQERKIEAPAH